MMEVSLVRGFHKNTSPWKKHTNLISAEIELNTKCVVDMEDNQTVLHPPPSNVKGENR